MRYIISNYIISFLSSKYLWFIYYYALYASSPFCLGNRVDILLKFRFSKICAAESIILSIFGGWKSLHLALIEKWSWPLNFTTSHTEPIAQWLLIRDKILTRAFPIVAIRLEYLVANPIPRKIPLGLNKKVWDKKLKIFNLDTGIVWHFWVKNQSPKNPRIFHNNEVLPPQKKLDFSGKKVLKIQGSRVSDKSR